MPIAPPMIIVTAKQNSFCAGVMRSIQTMKPAATRARAMKNSAANPPRRPGTKRRAAVVRAHEVEEGGDGPAVAELEVTQDQRLRQLVEQR